MKDTKTLIKSIQNLGYKILIEGDKIKLSFLGNGKPPEGARPLIKEIRENKTQVVDYLRIVTEMESIFKAKVNEISQGYPADTMSFMMIMFPKTYDKVIDLEKRMNTVWDEGKDIKGFTEIVNRWVEMHKKSIKLYCAKNGIDTILDDVYNASNGKPGPCQGLGKERQENGTL